MSMDQERYPPDDQFPGSSEAGFSAAVADAVRRAEEDGRLRPQDEEGGTIRLTVVSWEVDVHGPLGEYRVVLQRP